MRNSSLNATIAACLATVAMKSRTDLDTNLSGTPFEEKEKTKAVDAADPHGIHVFKPKVQLHKMRWPKVKRRVPKDAPLLVRLLSRI